MHDEILAESCSSDEDYAYTVGVSAEKRLEYTVRINEQEVKFLIDTGASVNIIDSKTYEQLKGLVQLEKCTTQIFAYGSSKPLPLKGRFQTTMESTRRFAVTHIYVTEGFSCGNLLSAKTAQELDIIKLANNVSVN